MALALIGVRHGAEVCAVAEEESREMVFKDKAECLEVVSCNGKEVTRAGALPGDGRWIKVKRGCVIATTAESSKRGKPLRALRVCRIQLDFEGGRSLPEPR